MVALLLIPNLTYLHHNTALLWLALFGILMMRYCGGVTAFTSVFILISNATTSSTLGAVNGIAVHFANTLPEVCRNRTITGCLWKGNCTSNIFACVFLVPSEWTFVSFWLSLCISHPIYFMFNTPIVLFVIRTDHNNTFFQNLFLPAIIHQLSRIYVTYH